VEESGVDEVNEPVEESEEEQEQKTAPPPSADKQEVEQAPTNPKKRKSSSMILTSADFKDLPEEPAQKRQKMSSDLEDKLSKPLGSLIEEKSEERKKQRQKAAAAGGAAGSGASGRGRRRGGRGRGGRGRDLNNTGRSVTRIPNSNERVYKSDSYRIPPA